MFQDKIKSVGDSLCKSLILENLLAPLTELEHDPYALTGQLEVSSTYRAILVVVILVLLGNVSRILILPGLEHFYLFHLYKALLQTIGHVIDQAVQESLKYGRAHLIPHLLTIAFEGPEPLKNLLAIVTILEFCEKHALTREFNVDVEGDDGFHEKAIDNV